jgi:hypothetical protein
VDILAEPVDLIQRGGLLLPAAVAQLREGPELVEAFPGVVEAVVGPIQLLLGRLQAELGLMERRAPVGRPLLEQGP